MEDSFNSLLEKLNKQITLQDQKNQEVEQENEKLVERVSSLEREKNTGEVFSPEEKGTLKKMA